MHSFYALAGMAHLMLVSACCARLVARALLAATWACGQHKNGAGANVGHAGRCCACLGSVVLCCVTLPSWQPPARSNHKLTRNSRCFCGRMLACSLRVTMLIAIDTNMRAGMQAMLTRVSCQPRMKAAAAAAAE